MIRSPLGLIDRGFQQFLKFLDVYGVRKHRRPPPQGARALRTKQAADNLFKMLTLRHCCCQESAWRSRVNHLIEGTK